MIELTPEGGPRRSKPVRPKFNPGQIVATPGALDSISQEELTDALNRHIRGDWGDVCSEDKATNDESLQDGGRLLSSYESRGGVTFWIITEWDRSVTTFLLPDEY